MEQLLSAKLVIGGTADAEVLASNEPLSLWGGLSPTTGEIIDRRHDLSGAMAAGKEGPAPNSVIGRAAPMICMAEE